MERELIKRGLNRIIWLPIVVTVLYALLLWWQLDRMVVESNWVAHTTTVISLSNDGLQNIASQEAALRGYLLTSDSTFLGDFRSRDYAIDTTLQSLHQMVLDNPLQTRRLDSILQIYWEWQASAGNRSRNLAIDTSNKDVYVRGAMMLTMRSLFGRFRDEEQQLYAVRLQKFKRGTSLLTISITLLTIFLGILIALSARKQAKRFIYRFGTAIDDAKRSTALIETTLLSIGDAIIVTNKDAIITIMNPRAEELTGWALEEARGRSIDEVFQIAHETGLSPLESPIHRVLREGRIIELSNHSVLLSRTGLHYPIDDSASPILGSNDQIIGVVLVFRDISSRRESEQDSRRREREFRALTENAPDVIIRYGRDLRIEYVNPAVENMLGIQPKALIGRRFKDVGIPEEVYAPWEKSVEDVFTIGRSISTEVHYQTLHGYRKYQARLVPETDTEGVESVISISRDITDIKQTEERLRESEQRFRGVVENSPDAFFLLRALRNSQQQIIDFVFEYVNQRALQILNPENLPIASGNPGKGEAVQFADIAGKRYFEVFKSPRSKEFFEHYCKVITSNVPMIEEYKIRSPYIKSATWLRSMYVPIDDNLAITTTDISDRKATEELLKTSEARYRDLVTNASEAIFSTDPTGLFTYANPFIREMSGYKEDDLSDRRFTDMIGQGYRDRVKRHFYRQFLSRARHSYIEAPFITKTGEERWLAVTTTLQFKGEEVVGFDCVGYDITHSKAAPNS